MSLSKNRSVSITSKDALNEAPTLEKTIIKPDDKKSPNSKRKCSLKLTIGLSFAALTVIVGIAMLAGGFDALFDVILQSQVQVTPGSTAFDIWKYTPVPMSLKFFLYNLTNPEEFTLGSKPVLEEIGPYVYNEYHQKKNETFNANFTVSFYQQRWWVWDAEASGNYTEEDIICILNTVPVSAAYSVSNIPPALEALNFTLAKLGEEITMMKTVREILFDGYEDPLLDLVQNITSEDKSFDSTRKETFQKLFKSAIPSLGDIFPGQLPAFNVFGDNLPDAILGSSLNLKELLPSLTSFVPSTLTEFASSLFHEVFLELVDLLPPGLLNYDRMGWFYKRNLSETYDGHFTMFTGEDTVEHVGNIDLWNGIRDTEYFTSPCNGIWGSAGEVWPPEQSDTNISFYSPDLCMTLTLQYKEPMVDDFGIKGYRYWADNKTFAHPSIVPENQCYCFKNKTKNCPPSGLLDAQTCRMGSPAYISFPHFLHGDPRLLKEVDGLDPPDEEKHQLHIDMIPELGVPLKVNARMQINMQVRPYPGGDIGGGYGRIDLMANLPEVILPLLWFEVTASLTDDLADDLGPVLFILRTPTMTIIWSLMIVLPLLIFLTFVIIKHFRKSS